MQGTLRRKGIVEHEGPPKRYIPNLYSQWSIQPAGERAKTVSNVLSIHRSLALPRPLPRPAL